MNDLRFAFRQLFKTPGFTAVAVLTLALGIGANTAIFSIADTVLFRPIDLKDLDRLVALSGANPHNSADRLVLSPADYFRFKEEVPALEEFAVFHNETLTVTGGSEPEVVKGCRTTINLFAALNVPPVHGRTFSREEGEQGRGQVVVLSDRIWRRLFAADPTIVGQAIELNGVKHDVIGIARPEANVPPGTEMWVPYNMGAERRHQHGGFFLRSVGRLKPGASRLQAELQAKAAAFRMEKEWPDSHTGRSALVEPFRQQWVGSQGPQMLGLLMGAVAFVLLIACVNVAILQLARMTSRARERAVRAALGASRARLISQVLVESVLLGSAGALVAILFAQWGVSLLKGDAPAELAQFFPNWRNMGVNGPVLLFLTALGAGSGIIAGLIPAFLSSRLDLNEALKSSTRNATGARSHHRLKSGLVIAQIALALVLLVGASLMVRGFRNLATPNAAIPADQILRFRLALPSARYGDDQRQLAFVESLMTQIAGLNTVESTGLISRVPYCGDSSSRGFYVEGRPKPRAGELPAAQYQLLQGDYLEMMKIGLQGGRRILDTDTAPTTRVCLISQSLARNYFPNENPVGKRIRFGEFEENSEWWTVAGITDDIPHSWELRTPQPTVYLPYAQAPSGHFDVLVKASNGDANSLIPPLRSILRELDPQQPIHAVMTLERVFKLHVFSMDYLGKLMALFGILALILSTTGIYSVIAFAVAERTPEIAVRMALGAEHANVLWLSLKRAVTMILVGVPIGLLLAFALGRGIANLIYGISATDPRAFGIAVFSLVTAALLAGYISARRALKIDPMEALRNE